MYVPLVGARYIFVNAGGPFLCQKQLKLFLYINIFTSKMHKKKKTAWCFRFNGFPLKHNVVKCNEQYTIVLIMIITNFGITSSLL